MGIENVNCPVILVVKKNKRILNNLIKWLSDNNTQNAAGQIDLPLMLIDDEADNASVNTKDEDSQPAAINDCIRRLLNLFSKTTYLGITATPFANIFIDPEKTMISFQLILSMHYLLLLIILARIGYLVKILIAITCSKRLI